MSKDANVVVYKDFKKPVERGVYHRLVCMTGKNKGEAYYLRGKRVVLGRGDRVDIFVDDVKSSREHAEIIRINDQYVVTDLGSQNGIYINELKVTQHTLQEGDRIIIGQIVLKFGVVHIGEADGQDLVQGSKKHLGLAKGLGPQGTAKRPGKILLYAGLVIFMVIILFPDEGEKSEQPRTVGKRTIRNVTNDFLEADKKKEQEEDRELQQKLNVIFNRGLRENREGNYFRAIAEFNLVLILSPGNGRAKNYLETTRQMLDKDIKASLKKAIKDENGLKYQSAIVSYCYVIRLLEVYKTDERYKSAEARLRLIENKMGLKKDEIKCL